MLPTLSLSICSFLGQVPVDRSAHPMAQNFWAVSPASITLITRWHLDDNISETLSFHRARWALTSQILKYKFIIVLSFSLDHPTFILLTAMSTNNTSNSLNYFQLVKHFRVDITLLLKNTLLQVVQPILCLFICALDWIPSADLRELWVPRPILMSHRYLFILSTPLCYIITLTITGFPPHFQALVPPVGLLPGFLPWSQFPSSKSHNLILQQE